jgi:glutamate carboxypeptidase
MTHLPFCESERSWLIETIEALVRCESPATDKAAVDRCASELETRLAGIGGQVRRLPQRSAGDHIRAEFGQGPSQVLLLGHFDTVWRVGQLSEMPLCVIDGRLHGPGVYDMKAGIAIGMLAIRALLSRPPVTLGRIVMLLTSDEETGSDSSRAMLEDEARRSQAVLVLEPSLPGGAVKTQRKGCGEFLLKVRGVAAHAGTDPRQGASAIEELGHQIQALERIQDPSRGVTVNVGTVGGGTRTNVVAAEAWAGIDVRIAFAADAPRIESAIRGLQTVIPGTSLEITGAIDRPPMERSPAVLALYGKAREVATTLGRSLGEGGTGGGSDGNFTAALGVPTLDGLGAVGAGAHAADEHVVVSELAWRAALVAGLVERIFSS